MLNVIQMLRSNGCVVNDYHRTRAVHNLNYVWKIDNYSYRHEKKLPLKTPLFTADSNREYKWYLKLKRIRKVENEDVMGLFLYLNDSSECERLFVKYKFSIIDDEFKAINVGGESVQEFKRGNAAWGFSKFISVNDLFNKQKLFPNDELTIYCEATFSECKETTNESILHQLHPQPNRSKRSISKDFGDLFKDQKFADVSLSVNGVNYQAHKLVLAARSPVFAAMFEHDTKENETNQVEIADIEGNVVEEMLRYIYTDQCENLKDVAGSLFIASDKYNLEGLKIMCEEALIRNLTVENAAETLNLAELHCATELKSKTINFVVANSVEILNTANWKNAVVLYPQSLMLEIFEAFSRQNADSVN